MSSTENPAESADAQASPAKTALTIRFSEYLSMIPATARMMRNSGRIRLKVVRMAPGTPNMWNPTYVAMLMPMGPGVDSETATMLAMSAFVNQSGWVFDMSVMKGRVASPPPTAKRPVLKKFRQRRRSVFMRHPPSRSCSGLRRTGTR